MNSHKGFERPRRELITVHFNALSVGSLDFDLSTACVENLQRFDQVKRRQIVTVARLALQDRLYAFLRLFTHDIESRAKLYGTVARKSSDVESLIVHIQDPEIGRFDYELPSAIAELAQSLGPTQLQGALKHWEIFISQRVLAPVVLALEAEDPLAQFAELAARPIPAPYSNKRHPKK